MASETNVDPRPTGPLLAAKSTGWTAHSSTTGCSLDATMSVISDRWTLLILRNIFRGVRRFGEMQTDLSIAKNVLADRLSKLVERDVLVKVAYQEKPTRYEYHLTERGTDLSHSLIALMGWGDRWFAHGSPPTVLVHDACGTPLVQKLECPSCNEEVRPNGIRSKPGQNTTELADSETLGENQ